MKLYLRPKGENGLPLHPTANVEECMKSYDKVVDRVLAKYPHLSYKKAYHAGETRDHLTKNI